MGVIGWAATTLALLGGLNLAHATPETTPTPEARLKTCLDGHSLNRRMVVDKTTVLIEDGFGRSALLKLSKPCQNLDDLDRIGFEFIGSTQICGRHDVKILYSRFNEAPLRCLIESITPLSKAEAQNY
ncbi:DUF6491 family protein [Asticcacaulis sp. BYS171W]|uniref:DUF6491 family protein n=1 Tax=Asticcacaulis aquaticus TaxID=2984212 RepID=A0ABT5HUD1_9CAUL|nr:DUF6491 family protein [Asticcacaulis aquaticus]MDC7683527.1 DUF6491 family protein [Asticcacaulis aquaticus]